MKKKIFLILTLIIILTSTSFGKSEDFNTYIRRLNVDGVGKTVNIVEIDLNNKDIEFEVVTPKDGIIGAESFTSMINRKQPKAAINANFFASYDTLQPYGTIVKDGKFTYLEGKNTSLLIDKDNNLDIKYFSTKIKGYINGKRENKWNNKTNSMDFYLFDVWYVNVPPIDTSGVYIYTPDRGDRINLNNGTVIEVKGDKIIGVKKNPGFTSIDENGYLIYYGKDAANDNYINNRFKNGRTIELEYDIMGSATGSKSKKAEGEKAKEDKGKLSAKNTKLFAGIDRKTENVWNIEKNAMDFNTFNVWYINDNPIDSQGVYLYTPEKGTSLKLPKGHIIRVEKGKIIDIKFDVEECNIPRDGYVIYFGKDVGNTDYIKNRFQIGKTVDFYNEKTFKFDTENIIKNAVKNNEAAIARKMEVDIVGELNSNNINSMISAGPFLVDEGKLILDCEAEGFYDAKISKNRALRSALGITKDNKLLFLTCGNLNMRELGDIMLQLDCEKAMNLDGGASSALYGNGKIMTQPGRNLNTVFMVHDRQVEK